MAADQIVLAAIAGAHGIRGEVRLKLFTDDAQSLARHARFDAGGRALVLAAIRADKPGTAIARFDGISESVKVVAGSSLSQPAGVAHNVIGQSDDLELIEINMPADYITAECDVGGEP